MEDEKFFIDWMQDYKLRHLVAIFWIVRHFVYFSFIFTLIDPFNWDFLSIFVNFCSFLVHSNAIFINFLTTSFILHSFFILLYAIFQTFPFRYDLTFSAPSQVFIFTVMVIIVGLPLFPYVASVPDRYINFISFHLKSNRKRPGYFWG